MKIIAVHSSKGGSGKTFLIANMGKALTLMGKRCVIMDGDISGPSFNAILPPKSDPEFYTNDILLGKCPASEAIYSTTIENLDIIFANPSPTIGEGLLSYNHETQVNALRNLSNAGMDIHKLEYDALLIDTTPGLNPLSINALLVAQSVALTIRPDSYSLKTTNHILQTVYAKLKDSAIGSKKYFVIFNQVPHASSENIKNLLIVYEKELQKNLDIEVLGHIHCLCTELGEALIHTPILDEGKPGISTIMTITKKIING